MGGAGAEGACVVGGGVVHEEVELGARGFGVDGRVRERWEEGGDVALGHEAEEGVGAQFVFGHAGDVEARFEVERSGPEPLGERLIVDVEDEVGCADHGGGGGVVRGAGLSPGGFGGVAHLAQERDDGLAQVALEFDRGLFVAFGRGGAGAGDGAADAELAPELRGERGEVGGGGVEAGDDSDELSPSLLAADARGLVGGGADAAVGGAGARAVREGAGATLAGDGSFEGCAVEEAG